MEGAGGVAQSEPGVGLGAKRGFEREVRVCFRLPAGLARAYAGLTKPERLQLGMLCRELVEYYLSSRSLPAVRVDTLLRALEACRQVVDVLEARVRVLDLERAEVERLKARLRELEAERERLARQLEEEKARLQAENQRLKARVQELQEALKSREARLGALVAELNNLQAVREVACRHLGELRGVLAGRELEQLEQACG
jgi:ATP-dependent Clp protease ATP-binding subunit ClpA